MANAAAARLCFGVPSQCFLGSVPAVAVVRRRARVSAGCWRQVVDSSSGKPYYWNTKTNETRWDCPKLEDSKSPARLPEDELTEILLAADKDKFGDIANNYRPQCFELEYFDYLSGRIEASQDPGSRLALERLRARLSNPLLKNPPPYL